MSVRILLDTETQAAEDILRYVKNELCPNVDHGPDKYTEVQVMIHNVVRAAITTEIQRVEAALVEGFFWNGKLTGIEAREIMAYAGLKDEKR